MICSPDVSIILVVVEEEKICSQHLLKAGETTYQAKVLFYCLFGISFMTYPCNSLMLLIVSLHPRYFSLHLQQYKIGRNYCEVLLDKDGDEMVSDSIRLISSSRNISLDIYSVLNLTSSNMTIKINLILF